VNPAPISLVFDALLSNRLVELVAKVLVDQPALVR
jgi:hypothetical protein